ncbi:polysaccharide biosynthesis tyrosine autokinase [Pseudarthrobacter oxydans]|uniref:polysaccharide biosynthesis tyrosine autokinase n=1 Tax=Pseudarthrobacter oxydans TaxID=1671 RepID=UPI003D2C4E2C
MDLSDYLRLVRRSWKWIVAFVLLGVLGGGLASVLVKPTYVAETQLFVAIQNSGSITELQQGNTFSQARVQSYVKTVTTPVVLQPAIDTVGLETTADALSERVKASTELNTVLINISVSDASPVQAAAIAQAVADSLISAIDNLEKPKTGGSSPVSLSVVRPAVPPSSPSAPNTRLNLILGLLVGLGLGTGVAVLKTALDTRVRGEADLRAITQAPVLGGISFDQDAVKKPLLTQTPSQGPRAESFRQLRTNLQFANVANDARSILVTSSLPGEGKSTTATNLAIALAQSGLSVCLVDADLRRPMINEYLGLDRHVGLTTALVGNADLNDLLQPWGEDNLFALTSGQIPPNPSELLGSGVMQMLLHQLKSTFDMVIVDAPPLLPVTDATVLAQHVDGIVLVVGTHTLRKPELARSLSALEMVDARLLGVVLNQIPAKGSDSYSYTYVAYNSHPTETPNGATYREDGYLRSSESAQKNQPEQSHGESSPAGRNRATRFPADRIPNS